MGNRRRGVLSGAASLLVATVAVASPVQPPLEVDLRFGPAGLEWSLRAHRDLVVRDATWKSLPAALLPAPPPLAGLRLDAGGSRSGRVRLDAPPGAWVELRVEAASVSGATTVGAATRRPLAAAAPRTGLPVLRPRLDAPGTVRGRFLYEDRIVDAGGYTGRVRRLPLRHVTAELVAEATGEVLARTWLDADGRFELRATARSEPVSVRLRSWTRGHSEYALRVVAPPPGAVDPIASAVPHEIRTTPFALAAAGADLGTLVERDPDGYGAVQAFHILDLAIDAFDAVRSPEFAAGGAVPTRADSLGIFWGPALRIRSSAQARDVIEITSPASGDTDGWSDAVVLHEVGHFIAQRFLRESNPGGIHLLGDVEQDLRLSWAEGLATAFACWVREWRAAARRDADGAPVDADVARYVNVGLPPPDGVAGGLQFAWDIEAHRLGARELPRDGIGSETTLAGLLWDVVDGTASADAAPGDDDATELPIARAWAVLRAMRDLPAPRGVTFEDLWVAWQDRDPEPAALAPLLRDARIEFVPDAAEPDGMRAPALWAARPHATQGGVMISEIVLGALIAIEMTNRDAVPHDLGGWSLVAQANGSSGAPSLTTTLPAGTRIGPGGRLVVHRGGAGPVSARDVVVENWTTPWFPSFEGAVVLRDAGGRAVDFVRWNGRDGVRSAVPPPPGTAWAGDVRAATFGRALSRLETLPDRDSAADFVEAEPSLGAPNDTPAVHRTFFPAADADLLRWEVMRDGVYTVEVRRPRNGAQPRLELRLQDAMQPLAVVTGVEATRVPARVTVRLEAGRMVEIRTSHVGTRTRFGTYDVALFAESDPRLAVPPVGLHGEVALAGETGRLRLAWWNGAQYDALRVRADGGAWEALAGDARSWEIELARGVHRVELAGEAAGIAVAAPMLHVDVDAWLDEVTADFDAVPLDGWELHGDWRAAPAPGRAGDALTGGAGTAHRVRAVRLAPGSVLEFEHICLAATDRAARLEISNDWGATWQLVGRWSWNDAPPGGDWRDGNAGAGDWRRERIALDAWADRPAQLRFQIAAGDGEGWRVDALRIGAAPPVPFALRLHAPVPNPFNPSTRLRFELSAPAPLRLDVYDVRGRHRRTLAAATFAAGSFTVDWNGADDGGRALPSGVYFARLQAGDRSDTRKLVLLR
jgi:hypothetical protein